MGDANGRDRKFAMQTLEVAAYLIPKFRIQIRQRFVEQECFRLAFDRLVGSGLIRLEDDDAIVVRPKLIEAFNDVRGYGITIDKLIDIHEQVLPLVDQISAILVRAGAEHVQDRIKPGEALPDDTEVAELITMLVRFRTQAAAAVTATLASSIETTIEELVSRILADYVEKAPDAEGS
jgi:hypothetical protein